MVIELKTCPECGKDMSGERRKYCSDRCKYWYNIKRRERESHLPPVRKRTDQFFSMVTGYGWAKMKGVRQGKRSGGMVTGSMSARVNCTIEEWAPITYENLKRHFTCISFYRPKGITLGSGERVREAEIFTRYGIQINF